jgi:hypothetical protein
VTAPGDSRIVVVLGSKGQGKSFHIKRGLARVPQWVVWDFKGEYADKSVGVAGARLWTDVAAWREHLIGGGDLQREVFACPRRQFPAWCRWVAETGDLLVVVEELNRYCSAGRPIDELLDLFDRSRHAHLDLVCAAPRLAGISKDLVHQADEIVTAQVTEPNDVAYLREWIGTRGAERVRTLQHQHFLRIRL